jgi:hypothetical protein
MNPTPNPLPASEEGAMMSPQILLVLEMGQATPDAARRFLEQQS